MLRLLAVFAVLLLTLGAVDARAKRVALVVGNAAYEHAPELANPVNDAEAMAAALQRLGFDVIKGIDVSRSEFEDKIIEFARAIRGADIALLYYAGHGLQVNGQNFLAPVETELQDEASLEFETVRLETIMTQMELEKRTNLIFLDACRNNPLASNLARSMGTRSTGIDRGLAPLESGIGTLISFATQPGNVALDGDTRNSPFTEALINHIETPGDDIAVLLRRVRQDVIEKTNGEQVPWSNSSLTGEVILQPKLEDPSVALSTGSKDGLEIAFWNSIANGDSRAYFEIYLKRFPDGEFVEIAKLKIAEIERTENAAKRLAERSDALDEPAEQQQFNEDRRSEKSSKASLAVFEKYVTEVYFAEKAEFASEVEYYDLGNVDPNIVKEEMARHAKRWPERSYELVPGSLKIVRTAGHTTHLQMRFQYVVRRPGRQANGEADLYLSLIEENGGYLVSSVREKIE